MTDIEKIRLLIGDKTAPYHFTDDELQAFLDIAGSVYMAAAMSLEAWAATLTETVDSEHIGDYSYTKKSMDNKLKLAQQYKAAEATAPVTTWAELDNEL